MSDLYSVDVELLHKSYPKELPDDFENESLKVYLLRIYTRKGYKFLISKTNRMMKDEIWRINQFYQCNERIIPLEIFETSKNNDIFKNTIFESNKLFDVGVEVYYQFILFKKTIKFVKEFTNKNYHINIEDEFYYKSILTKDKKEDEYWDSYYYYENVYYSDDENDADSEIFYFTSRKS